MIETTSLELSKKLVEAGVTGSHHFNWFERSDGAGLLSPLKCDFCEFLNHKMVAPAFTACELGKRLPEDTAIIKTQEGWVVESAKSAFDFFGEHVVLAEAMGLMLLWLYENGHVSAEAGGKKEDS